MKIRRNIYELKDLFNKYRFKTQKIKDPLLSIDGYFIIKVYMQNNREQS